VLARSGYLLNGATCALKLIAATDKVSNQRSQRTGRVIRCCGVLVFAAHDGVWIFQAPRRRTGAQVQKGLAQSHARRAPVRRRNGSHVVRPLSIAASLPPARSPGRRRLPCAHPSIRARDLGSDRARQGGGRKIRAQRTPFLIIPASTRLARQSKASRVMMSAPCQGSDSWARGQNRATHEASGCTTSGRSTACWGQRARAGTQQQSLGGACGLRCHACSGPVAAGQAWWLLLARRAAFTESWDAAHVCSTVFVVALWSFCRVRRLQHPHTASAN
jgi:hypothetical protein